MAKPIRLIKTTSGRWEVKGTNPEKWKSNSSTDWDSKSTGTPSLDKVYKWIEEMQEWSEMIHEAVLELREKVGLTPTLGRKLVEQQMTEVSGVVQRLDREVKKLKSVHVLPGHHT